jgi:hypothetical protein
MTQEYSCSGNIPRKSFVHKDVQHSVVYKSKISKCSLLGGWLSELGFVSLLEEFAANESDLYKECVTM